MTDEATAQAEEAPENITGLGDVFNDDKAEPEKGEAEPEKGEQEGQEPEAKKEPDKEPEAETPAAEPDSQETVLKQQISVLEKQVNAFKATALSERKKRQEAEKQIPDPVEDPEAYSDHIKSEQAADQLDLKINLSRDVYLDLKDDFEEKEAVFLGMVVDNDGNIIDQHLLDQFQASANPAKFAYDKATEKTRLEEVNSPGYVENLKQSLRKEILEDLKKESEKSEAAKVPDLTTATAEGGNSEPSEKPLTLSNVFG